MSTATQTRPRRTPPAPPRAPVPVEVRERTGLCECGCGQSTPIARTTLTSRGHYRGYPTRFVRGHHGGPDTTEPAIEQPATPEAETEWKERAACRSAVEPRAFEMPDGYRGGGPTTAAQLAGRRYCARCPVIDQCRGLADEISESAAWPAVGLWGGEWRSFTGAEPIRMSGPIEQLDDSAA